MHYDRLPAGHGEVTRAPYRQEPYVRATMADGAVVDGKATAWTDSTVLVRWVTDGKHHTQWMDAGHVQRITRAESAWQDPYDEVGHE